MQDAAPGNPDKPSLEALGADLLNVTLWQCFRALVAPFLAIALYVFFALHAWWGAAVVAVAWLSFVTYGSTSHDLVHSTLGLPSWLNTGLLTVIEMLCLRSGHAYRLTHLRHHHSFPHEEDVEGFCAKGGLCGALLQGPVLQYRLWWWAWKHSRRDRAWLGVEAVWFVGFVFAAVARARVTPVLWVYAVLAIGGSWVFPLVTVYLPHDASGHDTLSQTRLFRGWVLRVISFDHLYHLEHHLYPGVSHFQWKTLAKRLDPYFTAAGIRARRLGF